MTFDLPIIVVLYKDACYENGYSMIWEDFTYTKITQTGLHWEEGDKFRDR